jgi:alpha-galactosidase
MMSALNNANIMYAIDTWNTTRQPAVSNSFRVSGPVSAYPNAFFWIKQAFQASLLQAKYVKAGNWNDLGTLLLGNAPLTLAEEQSHFALWAFAKSPLFLSVDFSNLSPEIIDIVTNP